MFHEEAAIEHMHEVSKYIRKVHYTTLIGKVSHLNARVTHMMNLQIEPHASSLQRLFLTPNGKF